MLCNQSLEFFSSCKTETLPIKQHLFILPSTVLLSVSMNLTTLGPLYKWNNTVFVFFVTGLFHLMWEYGHIYIFKAYVGWLVWPVSSKGCQGKMPEIPGPVSHRCNMSQEGPCNSTYTNNDNSQCPASEGLWRKRNPWIKNKIRLFGLFQLVDCLISLSGPCLENEIIFSHTALSESIKHKHSLSASLFPLCPGYVLTWWNFCD